MNRSLPNPGKPDYGLNGLNNRVTANITYFNVKYKDLQYLLLNATGGGFQFNAGNIGYADNDGVETEFSFPNN